MPTEVRGFIREIIRAGGSEKIARRARTNGYFAYEMYLQDTDTDTDTDTPRTRSIRFGSRVESSRAKMLNKRTIL